MKELHDVGKVGVAVAKDVASCGYNLIFEGESYTGEQLRKFREEDVSEKLWREIQRLKREGK